MNIRKMLFFCLMAGVMFSSCIKDEPLNAEADITGITVDGPKLIRQPVITNNEVHFYVNGWEDVTHLAPKFTLTEGATIEPASGTERDFTQPQVYTVTSQDGKWKKTYKVSFTSDDVVTSYHSMILNGTSTRMSGMQTHNHRSFSTSLRRKHLMVTPLNGAVETPDI